MTLAFYRFTIAAVTILPFLLLSRHARLERGDVVPVCLLGAAFFGLFPWVFGAGMVHIPASRGALIFGAMPLVAMVVAAALRLEALTALKSFGAVLAFGGVALALGDRAALGADADDALSAWGENQPPKGVRIALRVEPVVELEPCPGLASPYRNAGRSR